MLSVLRNRAYALLFSAQVIALVGTGLLTIALGLLSFDIAGGDAGVILGVAMTVKMIAYVTVGPLIAALTARLSVLITQTSAEAASSGEEPMVVAVLIVGLLARVMLDLDSLAHP